MNNMLRSWKHIRADTKHTLTENPRRGVAGTQQGLQLKRRNLLQSKEEQPSSFLQAPPLQLLHSDFPLFHLNPSVKGNKHVCDICESNTSRRTLSAQCWQSSAAGKKKNLKSLSHNLSALQTLALFRFPSRSPLHLHNYLLPSNDGKAKKGRKYACLSH